MAERSLDKKKEIWVYIDHDQGLIKQNSLDLLVKAKSLTSERDYVVAAVLLTDNLYSIPDKLRAYGAEKIYLAKNDGLSENNHLVYGKILASFMDSNIIPDIFLFPCATMPSLVAAAVAAKLKTGLIAHCVDLYLDDQEILVGLVPAFGGQYLGEIFCPEKRPQMATVYAVEAEDVDISPAAENIIEIDCREAADKGSDGIQCLGEYEIEQTGQPIDKAEVVVCGGYGVGSAENWCLLEEFAGLINAAVGCTRPPIDQGWAENEQMMIGTSGKSVRPNVYIGFGVSGTSHHICGMKDSKKIFNINTDENALSFDISDYAYVADAGAILPLLIKKLNS